MIKIFKLSKTCFLVPNYRTAPSYANYLRGILIGINIAVAAYSTFVLLAPPSIDYDLLFMGFLQLGHTEYAVVRTSLYYRLAIGLLFIYLLHLVALIYTSIKRSRGFSVYFFVLSTILNTVILLSAISQLV